MKAQVLLPKVFNFPFTYNVELKCKIGDIVEVPFGQKKEIGENWQKLVEVDENCEKLTEIGRNWLRIAENW